ncbi:hypothetical protein LH336_04210 [Leptospira borgpetersenii]|nr:hypothetical protein [Leptospira borgpetersenii]MBE8435854.1 hypothetical protein [Leptospira borgpetersenii serovar Tarassovi]UVA65733.1 hypothetical protein LH336_04210 [Leptospira borgpetersenii]
MLFSNELNYWVIKKNAKKDLLLRMGRHIRACPKTSDVGTPIFRGLRTVSRQCHSHRRQFWDKLLVFLKGVSIKYILKFLNVVKQWFFERILYNVLLFFVL